MVVMTEGTRVQVSENAYDGDILIPTFKDQTGVVSEVSEGDPRVLYIFFDNPEVNESTDEAPETTWPFYEHELVLLND